MKTKCNYREADYSSATQDILPFYATRMDNTEILPLDSILSHMNPIHNLTPDVSEIHFARNINFPSTPNSPKKSTHFRLYD
jgi:hypothetical protein